MGLASYTELQDSLKVYAKRSGLETADVITLAHERIINGSGMPGDQYFSEALRLRTMLDTATITLSSSATTAALPSGFLEFAAPPYISLSNGRQQLNYVPPTQMLLGADGSADAYPDTYTIIGNFMQFANAPGADVSITGNFYKLSALSANNLTNVVLTNHPGCYLFGAMLEVSIRIKAWEEAQLYFQRYLSSAHGAQFNNDKAEYSGGTLVIQPDTCTP